MGLLHFIYSGISLPLHQFGFWRSEKLSKLADSPFTFEKNGKVFA